jgi:hypothetical protein
MKCLCKLEIRIVERHADCPVHVQHLTADEMNKEVVTAFEPKEGRWRCPVCGQWTDKNAGWRLLTEEVCAECYRLAKGGEPKKQGDDQWLPR